MMKFLVPQGLRPAGRFLYIGFKKKKTMMKTWNDNIRQHKTTFICKRPI